MSDIQATFPKAKVLNGDRVRFEIAGGQFRLIVAFDLEKQIAFVKFLGTHAEYDDVDALTVSQF
ncbi:type II toxin-antitoxin system HigB family toxin [Methylobacterium sp. J-076]|nr:type II toxin-antitoxin system HigB family toxin [Methylobacterium sp. J-076]